jgi:diguanylate cyclase (GGDEF)-like protein
VTAAEVDGTPMIRTGRDGEARVVRHAHRAGATEGDLDSIVALIATELGAEAALLTVHDGRPGEPHVYAAFGPPVGPTVVEGVAGSGSIGEALERGKPIAKRLRGNPRADGRDAELTLAQVLVAPIRAPSGTRAALSIGYTEPLAEGRDLALDAIAAYAGLLGLWLDDSGALVRLLRAAYEDGLTGCLTYPALIEELEHEIRRAERTGQPLACGIVDLDGSGEFVATNGRRAGNRAVAAAGSTLLSRVRRTDIVARRSGAEFVIVLPDTDASGASALADSLRGEVADAVAEVLGRPVEPSVGVGEWTADTSPAELVDRASAAFR